MPSTNTTDFTAAKTVAERTTTLLERMQRECVGCPRIRTAFCYNQCFCRTAHSLVEELRVSQYKLGVVDVVTGKLECRDSAVSSRAADKRYAEKRRREKGKRV